MMLTKTLGKLLSLATLAIGLSACSGDSDDGQARVRVLHASADAPAVNVNLNQTAAWEDLDYRQGTEFRTVNDGSNTIEVEGLLPDGAATVIGPVTLDLQDNYDYTVVALNEVAALEPLVIDRQRADVTGSTVRVQALHAAPAAGTVDVFVTALGADLASTAPAGTFAFKETLGPVDVPPGDYQVRVTPTGTPGTVVFDSGTVSLTGGSDLLLAAVNNTGPGTAPINLVVLDGSGSSTLWDTSTPANLRVVHAVADAPAVDVVVNDGFAAPLVEGLAFPDVTAYVGVDPGAYNVKVTPADNAGAILIDADLDLAAGSESTVLAVGSLATIQPLVLTDDNRSVATEAKVRLVHGAPVAGNVDIYVTAPGASLDAATPAITDFAFAETTGYLGLAPGSYDVTITASGSKTPAIGPLTVDLTAGGVYTAIAREAAGGGTPLDVILTDDF